MTREEAIDRLKEAKVGHKEFLSVETLNMAIQALEQEPCGDAISRQATLEMAYDMSEIDGEHFTERCMVVDIKDIQKLPPVTPQQKMGRWIEHFDQIGKWYECDQCHTDWGGTVNYCPNCGAKM